MIAAQHPTMQWLGETSQTSRATAAHWAKQSSRVQTITRHGMSGWNLQHET